MNLITKALKAILCFHCGMGSGLLLANLMFHEMLLLRLGLFVFTISFVGYLMVDVGAGKRGADKGAGN